jgi:hypothetical protein
MKNFRLLFSVCLILGLFVGTFGMVSADEGEPPEEETTLSEEETINQNPVVGFLAELTGLTEQEILDLQAEGYGLGEIAKAYRLLTLELEEGEQADLDSSILKDVLAAAKEMGWGEYYKSLDMAPGMQGGIGWLFKKAKQTQLEEGETLSQGKSEKGGPPEHALNNKEKSNGKGNKK